MTGDSYRDPYDDDNDRRGYWNEDWCGEDWKRIYGEPAGAEKADPNAFWYGVTAPRLDDPKLQAWYRRRLAEVIYTFRLDPKKTDDDNSCRYRLNEQPEPIDAMVLEWFLTRGPRGPLSYLAWLEAKEAGGSGQWVVAVNRVRAAYPEAAKWAAGEAFRRAEILKCPDLDAWLGALGRDELETTAPSEAQLSKLVGEEQASLIRARARTRRKQWPRNCRSCQASFIPTLRSNERRCPTCRGAHERA
jgi:hypothetical protein